VRNLKKLLEKIYRKVAFKLVKRQARDLEATTTGGPSEDSTAHEASQPSSGVECSLKHQHSVRLVYDRSPCCVDH